MALQALARGENDFDCGEAGTVLRFLALRVARETGRFQLHGSPQLFSRPQDELLTILRQLSSTVELQKNALIIESQGWRPRGDGLYFSSARSSQFASGLILNAWNLPTNLFLSPGRNLASPGYLKMTMKLVESLGMKIEMNEDGFFIPAQQQIKSQEITAASDFSSAFAIAAVAAVCGEAHFLDLQRDHLQPDEKFIEIVEKMGARVEAKENTLKICRGKKLQAIRFDCNLAPDLFPVLAVLCACAQGESELYGASQLKFKESDRVKKIAELLEKMEVEHTVNEDSLKIVGGSKTGLMSTDAATFDCESDHRLAMAAGLALKAGYNIKLRNPQVVTKSFPEYWQSVGIPMEALR